MRLRNGGKGEASFCIYRRVLLCRPEKKSYFKCIYSSIVFHFCIFTAFVEFIIRDGSFILKTEIRFSVILGEFD